VEVRAKKSLGQHFLVDLSIAERIVAALNASQALETNSEEPTSKAYQASCINGQVPQAEDANSPSDKTDVLEIGPGMGVLTRYLLQRDDINLKMIELDSESVEYLMNNFCGLEGKLFQADYLKLDIHKLFPAKYSVIGNFPYNISSQIFFKILDDRDRVPEVVCMIQKEVAKRIAEKPGSKTYGILSVLLQAWYDIEYLFTVEPGAFAPPPKVRSAVIRLRRNSRTALIAKRAAALTTGQDAAILNESDTVPTSLTGALPTEQANAILKQTDTSDEGVVKNQADGGQSVIDEKMFRRVVKTAFGQRRKTLRNALKPLLPENFDLSSPILQQRAEQLSVDDFIGLTAQIMAD
jgi:16S rRNA (adenine1518-N6/adenine1519-N6)-dimethyltransferase